MEAAFRETWPSRVALLIKFGINGTDVIKVRLIHDLRRSGVNAKVLLSERLVLPRVGDIMIDILELLGTDGTIDIDLNTADFKDAFKQILANPEERKFMCGKGLKGWFCCRTLLFGLGSPPPSYGAARLQRL